VTDKETDGLEHAAHADRQSNNTDEVVADVRSQFVGVSQQGARLLLQAVE